MELCRLSQINHMIKWSFLFFSESSKITENSLAEDGTAVTNNNDKVQTVEEFKNLMYKVCYLYFSFY